MNNRGAAPIRREFWDPCAAVAIVEVWKAEMDCAAILSASKPRNVRCKGQNPVGPAFEVTEDRPLVLDLRDAAGAVVATRSFYQPRGVYAWRVGDEGGDGERADDEGAAGEGVATRSVRITLGGSPGGGRGGEGGGSGGGGASGPLQLALAEVLVYEAGVGGDATDAEDAAALNAGDAEIGAHAKNCGPQTCDRRGGKCRQGRCVCNPDYVGSDCSQLIKYATRYLPADPAHGWFEEYLAKRATQDLKRAQSNCRGVVENQLPGPSGKGAGLGSTMYWRAGAFSDAFSKGKGYMFTGRFNYAENPHCAALGQRGRFECYFEPAHEPACESVFKGLAGKFKGISKRGSGGDCTLGKSQCNGPPGDGRFDIVPKAFAKKGVFYWRAIQMAWLMRLNNATRAEVDLERIKAELGFAHPIVGVHVRHGDGCLHGRRKQHGCKPLSFYMEEVRAMRDMYGVNRVFIATDSTTALADTKQYEPEFEFIHLDMDREKYNTKSKIESQMASGVGFDSHDVMISSLRDTLLLAESDYLVTHQASTMSRIALQLATLRLKHVPPYVSMDGPWCYHWRMCCDVTPTGKQTTC